MSAAEEAAIESRPCHHFVGGAAVLTKVPWKDRRRQVRWRSHEGPNTEGKAMALRRGGWAPCFRPGVKAVACPCNQNHSLHVLLAYRFA